MNLLGPVIVEPGIDYPPLKKRETVRAIILNKHNQVLMLYSHRFLDYTFPGGGLKTDEKKEMALIRELNEELGATKVKIIAPFGKLIEIKHGLFNPKSSYEQTSYYYLVEIEGNMKPKPNLREQADNLEPMWQDIDVCLHQNEAVLQDVNHQAYGLRTVLIRENIILTRLKEKNHETL